MTIETLAALIAAWLAAGHTVTQCPTRYAHGALRSAVKHMAS